MALRRLTIWLGSRAAIRNRIRVAAFAVSERQLYPRLSARFLEERALVGAWPLAARPVAHVVCPQSCPVLRRSACAEAA